MKVMVALHGYGDVKQETVISMIDEIEHRATLDSWRWMCPPRDAELSRARSTLLTLALGEGADTAPAPQDVLVWLDRDMQWAPGDLVGLVEKCRQTKGVVGVPYPFRTENTSGFSWSPIDPHLEYRLGVDQLHPAKYVGGGFCAFWMPTVREAVGKLLESEDMDLRVHRCRGRPPLTWFYDLCRPISKPFDDDSSMYQYLSNDWSVMERLRSCGVSIHGWSGPFLTHHGDHAYTYRDAIKE